MVHMECWAFLMMTTDWYKSLPIEDAERKVFWGRETEKRNNYWLCHYCGLGFFKLKVYFSHMYHQPVSFNKYCLCPRPA